MEKAEAHYRKAVQCDPAFAEPHRALGFLYYKRGQPEESAVELQKYLTLFPDAPDRGYVIRYIQQMKQD